MRTLMKVTVDVIAGNKAIAEGSLPKVIQSTMERIKPEASYFFTEDGQRSCIMVFDLHDTSEIPVIAEPLFSGMNAKVSFSPVMTPQDLQKGLKKVEGSQGH